MPRSKPRFSDLKDKMITAMAAGADPKQSADLETKKFSTWYLEPQNRQPLNSQSVRKRGALVNVAIYAFALAATATPAPRLVTMSVRAADWLKEKATVKTATNIVTAANTIQTAQQSKGFYPAIAAIREFDPTATTVERTSKITGRKYKTQLDYTDQGYSIPFGTNAAGETALTEAQDAIIAAVNALTSPKFKVMNFKPEEYTQPGTVYSWA